MSDIMRLAGINSGYDSEAMIQQMMSAYQTKIDNQNKKLTKLQWQQEAYRDVTSKLTAFKNKYFDILKRDSYLLSPSTFSKFKTSITAKNGADKISGINVTTTSKSVEGNHTVKVKQTATAAEYSGKSMTPASFSLDLEKAANASNYETTTAEDGSVTRNYKFALDVKVGDVSKTIEFDLDIAETDGKIDQDAFNLLVSQKLDEKLGEEFGMTGKNNKDGAVSGAVDADGNEYFLQTKLDGNKLSFEVGGNTNVTIAEKEGNFGLAKESTSVAIAAQAAVTGKNSLAVTVNGVTKNVEFDGVSATYFDSRNDEGNEAILAEYNELKTKAYQKEHYYGLNVPVTQEQLDSFTYTSTQAAKDKNAAAISSALNEAFADEGVTFGIDDKGYMTATKDGELQKFTATATSGGTLGLQKSYISNKFETNTTLREMGVVPGEDDDKLTLTINGKEVKISADSTMDDLVKAVNASGAGVTMTYSKLENKFVITANDMGSAGKVEIEGDDALISALGLSDGAYTAGKNAVLELDGVEIVHNSNSYEIDGSTINFEDAELDTEFNIGISKDFTDVKQVIKDFVNDYNQLIDDVYGHIGTAPSRDSKNNKYEPLSDTEKEDMSEDEIKKWEEAAKKGVIYNDSTVSGIMSKLRSVLYNAVTLDDGSKFGLYNMGITTKKYSEDAHGKLEIDEDALDAAFENNPDAVMKLFTDTNGVMSQVNTIIDDAVRTTGTVKGSLVRKAGIEGQTSAKDNEIYRQMEQVTKRINQLQDRYDQKEEYWWSVFTNLEKMMSDFNSQSSYLSSYLGGFGSTQ